MGNSKHSERRRSVHKMDPDCAICGSPATARCGCEANALQEAVMRAEQKIMAKRYEEIREWVQGRAQDYILGVYHDKLEKRRYTHSKYIKQLNDHSYRNFNCPPSPQELQAAEATLKRGTNKDWRDSVYMYPEVLEYFYSLIKTTIPSNSVPEVVHPPALDHATSSRRKVSRRSQDPESMRGMPGPSYGPPPPSPPEEDRRTPGPPSRRPSFRPPPSSLGFPPQGPPPILHPQFYSHY